MNERRVWGVCHETLAPVGDFRRTRQQSWHVLMAAPPSVALVRELLDV